MAMIARSQPNGALTRRQASSRQQVRVQASADNTLMRKPDQRKPEPEPQRKLFNDGSASPAAPAPGAPAAVSTSGQGVTIEFQRARAKEMRAYFVDQKAAEVMKKAQVFGWTSKNEINNGRWVMFGLMVGMLTEYATGVDFPHQLALMGSYLGIVDMD